MAIFRGGVKIFGSDIRLGITRDKSLDNINFDPVSYTHLTLPTKA